MVEKPSLKLHRASCRPRAARPCAADLTVWAAGIKAPAILGRLDGLPVNRLGQLSVRPTLQTEIDDNVFALGDCAACPWPGTTHNVPPRAQAAHQQASFLLKALACRLDGKPLPELLIATSDRWYRLGTSAPWAI